MKKALLFYIVMLMLMLSFKNACATTYTWTGLGGNSNWNNNSNWVGAPLLGATYPKAGDAAQIGVVAILGVQPTINAAGLTCATLTIGSLTAVTLTVSNPFTVSGAITINGGCIFTSGSKITAASLTVNAVTFELDTPLALSGAFTAAAGSTVNSNSGGAISAASMGITSSTFSLGATNVLTGALTVNNGTTTTYNSSALTTAATMSTGTGTLALNGALSISGAITVKGTTISGSAVATVNTAGMSLTSADVTLNGVLTSTAVVQVPSPGGTDCTLTTNATGNLLSGGIYDHTGSNLTWNGSGATTCAQGDVSSGQTLTIGAGNTINFTGAVEMHASATDGNLVNNGFITMTNASMFSDNLGSGVTSPITNNAGGIITLTGSSAVISAGAFTSVSNSGTITAGSNTNINIGGHASMINNTGGIINLSGAKMTLAASGSLSNTGNINALVASTISTGNPGTVTNNSGGVIALNASTMTVNGAGTLTNSGTITGDAASTISTNNPTTVTNNATGIITVTGSTLNFNAGTTSITNSGQINANALSTINTGNPAPITNSSSGSISISASTLNLAGGSYIKNSGVVSAVSNSTVTMLNSAYVNDLTAASSFTVSGSLLDVEAGAYVTNSGALTTNLTSTVKLNGNTAPILNSPGGIFTANATTYTMVAGSSITNDGGTTSMTNCTINGSGNPTKITNQNNGGTGVFTMDNVAATFTGTGIITNSGNFTANDGTSINMTTTSASGSIVNTGNFYAGTKGSPCIITLNGTSPRITNGTATVAANFYLGSSSILYPTSTSTLVTNTVTSPTLSTFVLQSDSSGTAAIGPVPAGANPNPSLVGVFNAERYFQGSPVYDNINARWVGRNYRIISSPVNIGTATKVSGNNVYGLNYIVGATAGQTATANSSTNAFITGCTGCSTSTGNPSAYLYKESIIPSNATFTSGNFLGITNITSSTSGGTVTASDGSNYSVPIGTGIFLFFRGAATGFSARTSFPYLAPEDVTLTSTGSLNQGSVTFKDWFTPTLSSLAYTVTGVGTGSNTNTAVRGFNMIGNPYPCSIDWNTINTGGITAVNINPTIYVFDPVTSQYDTYNSTTTTGNPSNTNGIIESGQGFFVQANKNVAASNPSLVINETAKSPTSQRIGSNLLMGSPVQNAVSQLLRLRLAIDTLNYDDIVIGFNSAASTRFEGSFDAEYLPGINAMEGLSSFSADGVPLAMNFLPLPKQTPQVINLNAEARRTGQYTLQKTALDALPQIYDIWLMDDYKKDSLDIRNNSKYIFDVDITDTNSYGKNRFRLVIRQNLALGMHLLTFNATRAADGAQATWATENEENYTNFTVERSINGGASFTALGGFASSAQHTYGFLDKHPAAGANRYRLKIEDLNGTISYSNIVTLMYGNQPNIVANNIDVYPNPVSGVINLSINQTAANPAAGLSTLQIAALTPRLNQPAEQSYSIKIINITGAIVRSVVSSTAAWQNNVNDLSPGTYVIQVVNNTNNSLVGESTFVKL